MRRGPHIPALLAAAAVLLPGACSPATPGATPSTSPGGACALTTLGDVATAFGRPFNTAKAGTTGGQATCLFEHSGGGTDTVSLVAVPGAPATAFYDTNRSAYPATDLTGIGDRAWVANDGGAGGVMKAGTAVVVHDVGFKDIPPVALQAKVKAFEQLLAARLP